MKYHVVNRKTGAVVREVEIPNYAYIITLQGDEELQTPEAPRDLAALKREWLAARRAIENIGYTLERMGV